MNKKLNTILFILGATLFNALVAVICFLLLMFLFIRFVYIHIPGENASWSFTLIFLVSIVASFFIYRTVLKYLMTKIDIEKYFDPIFVRKNLRKPGS